MTTVTSRRDHLGLAMNVFGAVAITLIINGIIFAAGWDSSDQQRVQPEFAPPGWVVGAVWVVLFAFMGAARWYVMKVDRGSRPQRLVEVLIAACALYPFYTAGLDNQVLALVGTVISFALAIAFLITARPVSSRAFALVTPVAIWTIFAAALIIREIQLN